MENRKQTKDPNLIVDPEYAQPGGKCPLLWRVNTYKPKEAFHKDGTEGKEGSPCPPKAEAKAKALRPRKLC